MGRKMYQPAVKRYKTGLDAVNTHTPGHVMPSNMSNNSTNNVHDDGDMDDFDFGDEGGIVAGQNDLPTRTNQQKMDSYNQEWDALMPSLVKAYINRFHNSNNTPQYNQYKETCIIKDQEIPYCLNCYKEEPVALMTYNLLAASPTRPSMAFHLSLLEFYSKLRGYGQTTVQAFSSTLSDVFSYKVRKAYFIYLEMIATIENHIHQNIWTQEEKGCPACPMDRMFVALDGNMQLKRRKLKENDVIKYINEDFFSADKYQDKYEDDQDQPSTTDECESNFKATTNASRSNARYHESGLVGSICARHDVPLEFTNIYQSGEKFKYALAVLHALLEYPGAKINTIMYDICCRIKNAIKVSHSWVN
ncbi:hypothetical protein INT45_003191 [Circinella minor]|uniref:CxC1-like cysteine cluster associated with KDZ transposases domain-containing protein n=1 Tax=Circinella minor TaxID=1195481 RepID=A0A8H7VD94_9FUNG|nr:hypothetical protein INT45_003191 [Circinella minor]